jgi:hypothetical protein
MNGEEYLKRLKAGLKDLSANEQADLLEEIAAHIETGDKDPRLGSDAAARARILAREMGSPEDLGRGLHRVHRPKRWIDYLLVVGPGLAMPLVVSLVMLLLFPQPGLPDWAAPTNYFGIRLTLVFHVILVGVALRRGGAGLLAYWLPSALLTAFALLYREKRLELWGGSANASAVGVLESLFWLAVFAGLMAWLVRFLYQQRRDPQIGALTLLLILTAASNLATGLVVVSGGFEQGYHLPEWTLFGHFGPYQVSQVLWPALFYLRRERAVRWLGLLIYALPFSLMNLAASTSYPALVGVWVLPVAWVAGFWLVEVVRKRAGPESTGL